jgi:hypothetical protein
MMTDKEYRNQLFKIMVVHNTVSFPYYRASVRNRLGFVLKVGARTWIQSPLLAIRWIIRGPKDRGLS